MENRFQNLPVDPDTEIRLRETILVGEDKTISALHEKWCWEGVHGESLILLAADVSGQTDSDLAEVAGATFTIKDPAKITISRRSGRFVFVNFNFDIRSELGE